MAIQYYSHSENLCGDHNPLSDHLIGVAKLAREFGTPLGIEKESELAGILHDLGKYGDLFQKRLRGEIRGIDHWSAGAWTAIQRYKQNGIASALAIQGHHIGLQEVSKDALQGMDLQALSEQHPLNLRLSEQDLNNLIYRLKADGLTLPNDLNHSLFDISESNKTPASSMLDFRMLYSILVDADYLDTEAHFNAESAGIKNYRKQGQSIKSHEAFNILLSYIKILAKNSTSAIKMNDLRAKLLEDCLSAAERQTGSFNLSAPTGSGKTLSMMAFALKHAIKNDLRRIIIVIPYLSIIEQTARVLKNILSDKFGKDYIIEDHSLVESGASSNVNSDSRQAKLLSENWDAPVIITTSVQFLESIFSNRPFRCRKLHRMAKSVVLFDEVQTLPTHAIIPTLATLSRICERYGSSIVFSTATQPAFNHLHKHVSVLCNQGWEPSEIVNDHQSMFKRASRVSVSWPNENERVPWEQLAGMLTKHSQVLCIVNLKRHAHTLIDELAKTDNTGLLHLSTNMCPAHRATVLEHASQMLGEGSQCRLISTQCIEAGVDIDFPVVYRAFGPLDSIAQAAGRCNRNGNNDLGNVTVFIPDEPWSKSYPDGAYKQAAEVTALILKRCGTSKADITDTNLFEDYFRELYSIRNIGNDKTELTIAIKRLDFVTTAKKYYVIKNQDTIRILVPYDLKDYSQLREALDEKGLTKEWINSAQYHSINIFRPKPDSNAWNYLDPAPIGPRIKHNREKSDSWYVYLDEEHYDAIKGLLIPKDTEYIIA